MNLRARIILAALAVIALVNVASVVYFVDRERRVAVTRLRDTIQENAHLLQVVTAGPLYDGNVAQLGATLDSIFANPDVLEIELRETRGDIAIARKRAAGAQRGERIQREIPIVRDRDELGKVRLTYSTANIEQRLTESRDAVVRFSMLLMAGLSILIYPLAARLTRPIERLTTAAHEIADGDLQRDIDVRAGGELAILAHSFVRMRDAVREKISDLAQKNQQLHEQIQERARAEDALRVSEERFSKMFREAPVVMALVRAADGRHIDVNREFEKQTGFSKAEALGRTALELGLWERTQGREEALQALQKSGSIDNMELLFNRRNGGARHTLLNVVTVAIAGEPCWLFTIRDITGYKKAQEALRVSDERLQQAVHVTGMGIFDHDHRDDTIYWSPEQRRIYGWEPDEEVTLQKYLQHVFPADLEWVGAAVGRAHDPAGDGRFDVEHRITRRDGEVRWLATRSLTLFEGEGKARRPARTVGAVLDVTERRNAEAMRARLAAIVENSVDAISSRSLDGAVLTWNKAAEQMFGYSAAEMVGKHLDLIVPAELREEVAQKRALLTQGAKGYSYDTVRLAKDGKRVDVSATTSPILNGHGELIGVSALFRDITGRKKAQEALRESEAKISEAYATLNDAIEGAPAAIAICDAEDRLFAFNSRFRAFFAFDEAILRPGVDFKTLLCRFTESGQLARPERQGEAWLEERYRQHRDPRGPIELELTDGRWLQITETRARSGGIVTVYNDISALKEREEQLQRLNEVLESKVAERTAALAAANEELEAFAYSVSHDLRAPLRGIDGFSQVLVSQYGEKLDPEARRLLERIRAGAQRMGHLITDLLELSRVARSAVERVEVDLSALAQGVVGELKTEAAGRTVEWRIEPGMKVRGDRNLLRIALVNLIGNALKYTRDASPARIEFGVTRRAGNLVEFCVRDNGAGFDMAYAERLFQPFQRLHAPHEFEGTGIGLATVQRVIAKHGGDVRGEGRSGAGASFYFSLPV